MSKGVLIGMALLVVLTIWLPRTVYAAGLVYDSGSRSIVPIPPSEKGLVTAKAEHFKQVDEKPHTLEGAVFGNDGTLFFCDVTANRILGLDNNNNIHNVAQFDDFMPTGLAFHPDGRLFATALKNDHSAGAIYAMKPASMP